MGIALVHPTEEQQIVTGRLSRAGLLRRGAAGSGALLLSGSAVSVFATAAGAATIPDSDLTYLRLLVGAELLAADFQAQAIASGKLTPALAAATKLPGLFPFTVRRIAASGTQTALRTLTDRLGRTGDAAERRELVKGINQIVGVTQSVTKQ